MERAFSLIELMIVITIIGILAAVAVPSYQDYVVRSRMTDLIASMQTWKTNISEYYNVNGAMPTGCPNTTDFPDTSHPSPYANIYRWCAANGIEVHLIADSLFPMGGQTRQLWLRPTTSNGVITWQCGTHVTPAASIPCRYLPASCQLNCNLSDMN